MGIEVVSQSVMNIPVGKYTTPMSMEIVSVVVQIVATSKKFAPEITNMRILVPLHGGEIVRLISADLCYIIFFFKIRCN